METQWLPVSLVVWFTALAGVLDALRQQRRFVQLGTGLLFARGRRTVTSWFCAARCGARLQALLLPARQRRSQDLSHRWGLAPHPSPPAPGRWAGHAAGLRHRRLAHQAVRAARRGRWQASQPHSGTGRVPVPLRPRLGSVWPAWSLICSGGSDRPADPLALVHPSQGCRLDGGLLRLAVPHRSRAGRRPDRVAGPAVGARSPADLGGDRRGLRQAAVLEADAGCGGDGDQRLRRDAALWSLPPVVDPGRKKGRGRPPKYGKDRIDLAKTGHADRGWQTGLFSLYGRMVVKKYKTFLATYKPVGGVIRVVLGARARSLGGVLLDRPGSERGVDPRRWWPTARRWSRSFTTSRRFMKRQIRIAPCVGQRGGVEPDRLVAHAGGAVGLGPAAVPVGDRSDSPWDKPERRPSHANRCQELRREALQEEYSSLPSVAGLRPKIRRFIQRRAPGRMTLTVLGKCSLVSEREPFLFARPGSPQPASRPSPPTGTLQTRSAAKSKRPAKGQRAFRENEDEGLSSQPAMQHEARADVSPYDANTPEYTAAETVLTGSTKPCCSSPGDGPTP